METKDYLILAGMGLATGTVVLFFSSFLYGMWLDYLEFGPAFYIPRAWELASIIILGSIAALGTRHDALGWYFSWRDVRWEDYRMPWTAWIPWQSFKVLIIGYVLRSTIFGLGLRALLLGYFPGYPLGRVVYGPLLSALLIRVVLYALNQLPSYKRTPVFYTQTLASAALAAAILTLKTTTPLAPVKIGLYIALGTAGLLLARKGKHQHNFIILGLLVAAFFLPNLAEVFMPSQKFDPNLELAGLSNLNITATNITGLPTGQIQQILQHTGKIPSIDTTTLLGKMATIPLQNYEKTGEVQTHLRDGTSYYVVGVFLVKEFPVNQNWKTMHLEYTSSQGIHAFDMAGNPVPDIFPQDVFYYGKDQGFENWAFTTDASAGGVIMTGLDAILYDPSLPEHLPGKLMRYREVDKRLSALLPCLEQSDAYLTTDGTRTYWTASLYAELPTDWVPNSRTKTLLEVGIATVDIRTGDVTVYETNENDLAELLKVSYEFKPMPAWLKDQRLYPEALLLKQLTIIDAYYPGTLAKLKPSYLILPSGPALVLEARSIGDQKITGYLTFGCGPDYGTQELVGVQQEVYTKDKVKELIRASSVKISEGVNLGPYVTAGRSRLGEPMFYPLEGRLVYITPLYVKDGNTNVVTHVVVTDASSNTIGVGTNLEKAMQNFLGV